MIGFLNKILKYGVRRIIVLILITGVNKVRKVVCEIFLSDNSPKVCGARIYLPTQFVGKGSIELNECQLGVWPSPYFITSAGYIEARSKSAKIRIDNGTAINNNFTMIADKSSIIIGKNCLIGPNFFITDSDFHGIEVLDRRASNYGFGPIIIGDDVFIGEGVKILKNVTIGDGAVVAAGSVVVHNLDAFSVYAGTPAKKIGSLKNGKNSN